MTIASSARRPQFLQKTLEFYVQYPISPDEMRGTERPYLYQCGNCVLPGLAVPRVSHMNEANRDEHNWTPTAKEFLCFDSYHRDFANRDIHIDAWTY